MGRVSEKDVLLLILAIFIPPLAVWIKRDQKCDNETLISLILWFLFWIPGLAMCAPQHSNTKLCRGYICLVDNPSQEKIRTLRLSYSTFF